MDFPELLKQVEKYKLNKKLNPPSNYPACWIGSVFPWELLSNDTRHRLYNESNSKGRANMIAAEVIHRLGLYYKDITEDLFLNILHRFGITQEGFDTSLSVWRLPKTLDKYDWFIHDAKSKRKRTVNFHQAAWNDVGMDFGRFVVADWNDIMTDTVLTELKELVASYMEGFFEIVIDEHQVEAACEHTYDKLFSKCCVHKVDVNSAFKKDASRDSSRDESPSRKPVE